MAKGKFPVPKHIVKLYGSARKFRASHRATIVTAENALRSAIRGSSYTPDHDQIGKALNLVRESRELCKVRNWEGRNRGKAGK